MRSFLLAAVLLYATTACTRVVPPGAPAPDGRVTSHVVIVSIDGLRPDAIARSPAPTLQRVLREGSGTLAAMTVLPSRTLPAHVSMLTGVRPAVHGLEWNTDSVRERGVVRVPTVFGVARAAGLRTAAVMSKAKLRHLVVPGTLDYWQAPPLTWLPYDAERTVRDAGAVMRRLRPNLLFVHIAEPDLAGHALGWMDWSYRMNVRLADLALRDLVRAADDAYGRGHWTLLLTADHGGHGKGHGSADPRDMRIPWIAWGEGVRAGHEIGATVNVMDTAATALWLLGVSVPTQWEGRPVGAAFDAGAALESRR